MTFLTIRLLRLAAATFYLPLFAGSALATPERCEPYANNPYSYQNCLNHELKMDHERYMAQQAALQRSYNSSQYGADREHAQRMLQMQLEGWRQESLATRRHELELLVRQEQEAHRVRDWTAEQHRRTRNTTLVSGFQQAFWGQ